MSNNKHIWQFSRVGGVNRVNLESGKDLLHLGELDQKLWTALSCPVSGLEIDHKTLALIDGDNDEKIRVIEILESVKWLTSLIRNPDELIHKNTSLPLSSINDDSDLGRSLLASSKQILKNIGKPDATFITVEDTSDKVAIFAETKFNGDGIITEFSTDDDNLKKFISDIVATVGFVTDRSGKEGISIEQLDAFYKNCENYVLWFSKSEANKEILPFGDNTAEAFSVFNKIKSKVNDYFLRCQLVEFDPMSANVLNSLTARFEIINNKDLSSGMEEVAGFPIAMIEAKKALSFSSGINPAWKMDLLQFKSLVFDSNGTTKHELTEQNWLELQSKFSVYDAWMMEKIGNAVEPLGIQAIRGILSSDYKEKILALIDEDMKLENESNNIFLVDKLVRYYRDLYTLLNNFVTFSDFYSLDSKAIFQAGSLYFDQRSCDLCIRVTDMARHNSMASVSGICLVYCDCYSKSRNERMVIVAAFTDGDVDNLVVGRNAIFYDRNGLDWDATIIKIIDNPISIRQAFWSPYRKFSKLISKQFEKIASSKEQEVHSVGATHIEKSGEKANKGINITIKNPDKEIPEVNTPEPPKPAATKPEPPPPPPFDIAKFAGIFAAIGLAFGAIGSVLAAVVGGFLKLIWWKMPLVVIGLILAISLPSMFLAWLKLRNRNLAPVLDANGWAVNAKATINIAFGRTLTHLATLPKNSRQSYIDPFKKKKSPILPILVLLFSILFIAFCLWFSGYLKKYGIG